MVRNLFISFCLLIAASAFAAPPPGADMTLAPWFHSLHVPDTEVLCCDISDCRHYPVHADGTHYQVFFDNRWLTVPTEAVSDRTDNPTGDYVTCIQRSHWTNGEPDGRRVLCLIKAPRNVTATASRWDGPCPIPAIDWGIRFCDLSYEGGDSSAPERSGRSAIGDFAYPKERG